MKRDNGYPLKTEKGMKTMADMKKTTFETVKENVKNLLLSKDFNGYSDFQDNFKKLSINEKIEFFAWIADLPKSPRKTLLFSAFIKSEKKKVSRQIAILDF